MIYRSYQETAIDNAIKALHEHKNTMVVAATGAGKTIMLSGLAHEIGGKTLIIQHRDELLDQNAKKFLRVNPKWYPSFVNAEEKNVKGDVVFAMQQSLAGNLNLIPKFKHVIVDECHHLSSKTYGDIIGACKAKNPDVLLSGFTATPERSDKKTLKSFFNNVSSKISIQNLIQLGFLVPMRCYVVDTGNGSELSSIQGQSDFGDQSQVARVLDTPEINTAVVKRWKEKAGNRKTIVFCASIEHATSVTQSFKDAGVNAALITGKTPKKEREATIKSFDTQGGLQVLVNVDVLTEGFDNQVVSCIVLLRQCSAKSAMIQMIGRGLRVVDSSIYPDVIKTDCIVLDFGLSLSSHGNLEQGDGLHDETEPGGGEAVVKVCPKENWQTDYINPDSNKMYGCGATVPSAVRYCPLCGFRFQKANESGIDTDLRLTEIDIMNASPFRWVNLFDNDNVMVASGFDCWVAIVSKRGDTFTAIGKRGDSVRKITIAGKIQALAAADDFMRNNESGKAATKKKSWLNDSATEKQLVFLRQRNVNLKPNAITKRPTIDKYTASCYLNYMFAERDVRKLCTI